MGSSALLPTLFRYQAWANNELFDKIESIDSELHKQERHIAIRLIDHSNVVARIFSAHLAGIKHEFTSDNTPETPELADLRAAVAASDRWYIDYSEAATSAMLSEFVPFVFTDGDRGCMSREEMLAHVITHSGYHRGEAGRVLDQLAVSPPRDTFAVYLHGTQPSRRLNTSDQRISA